MVYIGDVLTNLQKNLKTTGTAKANLGWAVTSVEESMRLQMDAADFLGDRAVAADTQFGMGIIFVAVSAKGRAEVHAIRIAITDWGKRELSIDEPVKFPDEVGQIMTWQSLSPGTLKGTSLDPKPSDLAYFMTYVADQSKIQNRLRYPSEMGPPFIVGELRPDGMHWSGDARVCSGSKRAKK